MDNGTLAQLGAVLGQALIYIVGAVIVIVANDVRTYVKGHATATQLATAETIVNTGVLAAEQMGATGVIASKKNFAEDFARQGLARVGITVSEDQLNGLIEAGVAQLNMHQADAVPAAPVDAPAKVDEPTIDTPAPLPAPAIDPVAAGQAAQVDITTAATPGA